MTISVGNLVKWIGYPGACERGILATGPDVTGIIICIARRQHRVPPRVDVLWGDGTIGRGLYVSTIEVISE